MFTILLNIHFPAFECFTISNKAHQCVAGSHQGASLGEKAVGGITDLAVLDILLHWYLIPDPEWKIKLR